MDAKRPGPGSLPAAAWHALSPAEALARLDAPASGLTTGQADTRLARDGPNDLGAAPPLRPLRLLLAQFHNLLVGLLLVAGAIAWVSGEALDAAGILAIVVLNAVIGFAQEFHAQRALAALRRLTAPSARVRRDGSSRQVAARDVVAGDVLELEAGDLVAADARLLEAFSLQTTEAMLTGESTPVAKEAAAVLAAATPLADRRTMVFAGTSVASGRAAAAVVATGPRTEFGQIGELLRAAQRPEQTPLQQNLTALGRALVWAALTIVALVFGLGLVRGEGGFELFLTSVALAVAAVPEGLPAVVTIALAVGVRRMARRRALVRRLHAVETLGVTDVICADKTGTLTFGEMAVRALWAGGRRYAVRGDGADGEVCAEAGGDAGPARELLTALVACNGARLDRSGGEMRVVGDPTEGALLAAGELLGVSLANLDRDQPRHFEVPFDAARKRMTIVRTRGAGRRAWIKGAPEVLLERCDRIWSTAGEHALRDADRAAVLAEVEQMSARALRVLLAGYRDLEPGDCTEPERLERDVVLLGLAGLQDPPRPQARAALEQCRGAGVRVAMITGDHPSTAVAVARELGLAPERGSVLTGPELDQLAGAGLGERIAEVRVFARVTAEHKLQIVQALQERGHVVAMTGDGVNDAPAVQRADIGIAMGRTGTEVTRQAADMVITDDDFATIVAAIEQGRGVYANIRKALLYLLATNCAELLSIAATVAAGLPMPLLPTQILWINLVTDSLPALCLATDPIDPAVMRAPPRARGERLTGAGFLTQVLLTAVLTAATVCAVFAIGLQRHELPVARAHAFTCLVAIQLLLAFTFRSTTATLLEVGVATNLRLLVVVALSLMLQLAAPHLPAVAALLELPPMPLADAAILAAIALAPVTLVEVTKLLRRAWRAARGADARFSARTRPERAE